MTEFKVMTWNVENLFHFGSGFGAKTQEDYTQKLLSLAKVILHLDPHVLAIQEIGDVEALEELVTLLEGRYPHTLASEFPDPRGIRVGFISKLEIEEHEEIVNFSEGGFLKVLAQEALENVTSINRMGRAALRIIVRPLPDIPIHLINAHLKSKLLTFSSTANRPRFTPEVDSYIDFTDALPSINDDPNLRRGKPGSDHAPIIAIFDL
jgi:hypothetical protein